MGIDIPGHCKTFPKVCLRYINVICFWVSSEWIIKPMIFFIQLLVWKNSGKRALCLSSYLIAFCVQKTSYRLKSYRLKLLYVFIL